MSKRSWPRSSTARVMGKGTSRPGWSQSCRCKKLRRRSDARAQQCVAPTAGRPCGCPEKNHFFPTASEWLIEHVAPATDRRRRNERSNEHQAPRAAAEVRVEARELRALRVAFQPQRSDFGLPSSPCHDHEADTSAFGFELLLIPHLRDYKGLSSSRNLRVRFKSNFGSSASMQRKKRSMEARRNSGTLNTG